MSRNKSCNFQDCVKQPSFNYDSIKLGLFCAKHKLDGMVNVIDKRCKYKDCTTIPSYNFKNENPLYCSKHKLGGMINVKTKVCEFNDCLTQPIYNLKGNKMLKYRDFNDFF